MVKYILADPTGNKTVLVESAADPQRRQALAAAIMAAEPSAEQLGFLCPPSKGADIGLYMAGGEFCGNACLSAAAWYLSRSGKSGGKLLVDISGADRPISVEIREEANGLYSGFVEMPLPLEISSMEHLTLVSFPGISHLILPEKVSSADAEEMIVPLCRRQGAEALGLMLLDEESRSLRPLVYVPGAGSLFWERSCASGTAAVGAALAAREGKSISLSLSQPGGSLSIEASCDKGQLSSLRLGGQVRLMQQKNMEI